MLSKKTFARLVKANRYEDPKDGSGDHAGIKILSNEAEQKIFDALEKSKTKDNDNSSAQEINQTNT